MIYSKEEKRKNLRIASTSAAKTFEKAERNKCRMCNVV
jgi:hypothetical protein